MRRDQHPIVDRVGDDVSPETEVVPRHGVGGAIPGVVDRSRNNAGIPDRLLDRVDPQPNGVEPSCELPRHRRFSRSREACENDEHGYNLHVSIRALVHIGGGVLCRATAHKTSTAESSTCSLKSAEVMPRHGVGVATEDLGRTLPEAHPFEKAELTFPMSRFRVASQHRWNSVVMTASHLRHCEHALDTGIEAVFLRRAVTSCRHHRPPNASTV